MHTILQKANYFSLRCDAGNVILCLCPKTTKTIPKDENEKKKKKGKGEKKISKRNGKREQFSNIQKSNGNAFGMSCAFQINKVPHKSVISSLSVWNAIYIVAQERMKRIVS